MPFYICQIIGTGTLLDGWCVVRVEETDSATVERRAQVEAVADKEAGRLAVAAKRQR